MTDTTETLEKLAASRRIEKIGLRATPTEITPNITNHLKHLGSGLEGDVYEYIARDGVAKAAKVFRPYGVVWDDDFKQEFDSPDPGDPLQLSKSVFRLAHTARWADKIQNPQELIAEVNRMDLEMLKQGIDGYHLRTLQESFARIPDLNIQGFRNYLMQKGNAMGIPNLFVPNLQIGPEFTGGLGRAINTLLGWASQNYPQLRLPKRMFPEFIQFGQFPKDFHNGKVAGRQYLIMEKVPIILGDYIESSKGHVAQIGRAMLNKDHTPDVIPKLPVSLAQIARVQIHLEVLASLGLTFGDLKLGNIAFDNNGEPILIDPTSVLKTGSFQDIATYEYLPPHAQQIISNGQQLRGDPNNDLYALQRILHKVQHEWMQAVLKGLRPEKDIMKTERQSTEKASTMLQHARQKY